MLRRVHEPPHRASILTIRPDLFQVICDRDMEGVVAKQATAKYTPDATTWVKIKNRHYSQAVGRADFFNRPKIRRSNLHGSAV